MPRPAEDEVRRFFDGAVAEHARATEAAGEVGRQLFRDGARVRLRYAGGALAAAHAPALHISEAAGSATPDATVLLFCEDEVPDGAAPHPWPVEYLRARGMLALGDAPVVVHELGSGAITMWDRHERLIVHRVPSAAALPWWERAAPLRPALFFSFTGRGRLLVHAGAVGDEGRGGVLLAGAGGSGKTTTALAALQAGLGYLADDYLLLATHPEPVAHNLFATAKLDAGHVARFPALATRHGLTAPRDEEEKAVLTVGDLLCSRLPVRAVVVPRIRGGRAALHRAAPGAALLALAPSTALQMPYDHGAPLAALSSVVRRRPCWFLDVGNDPGELAPLLDRALDDALVAA